MPSSCGITRSVTTSSTGCSRIAASAAAPSAQARTSKPCACSRRVMPRRCESVSSATSARSTGTSPRAAAAASTATRCRDGDSPSYSASSSAVEVSRVSTRSSVPHSCQLRMISSSSRSKVSRVTCRRASSGSMHSNSSRGGACCDATSCPVATASSITSARRWIRGGTSRAWLPRPITAVTSGGGTCQSVSISPVSSRWQTWNRSRSRSRRTSSGSPAVAPST